MPTEQTRVLKLADVSSLSERSERIAAQYYLLSGLTVIHQPNRIHGRLPNGKIGFTRPDFFVYSPEPSQRRTSERYVEVTTEWGWKLSPHKLNQLSILESSGEPYEFIDNDGLFWMHKEIMRLLAEGGAVRHV